MKHALNSRTPLLLAVALVIALPATAVAEQFTLTGSDIAIYNIAGEVEIVPGTGNSVVVDVTRGGDDGDELEFATGEIAGKQTLRVLYGSRNIRYGGSSFWGGNSNTTIRVGEDGRFFDGSTENDHGDKVHISSSGSGMEAHADLRIAVPKGQKVSLYLAVGEASASDIDGDLLIDVAAARVDTRNTSGNLVIDVGSGGVEVTGHAGNVNVDTGSGNVELMDVTGDKVIVDTGSGRVTGAKIEAKEISIDTGSGGVDLARVGAEEVSIDTGSGGVTVDLTRDVELLNIDTGSGGVTVHVPDDLGAEVSIETGSGGIQSDVAMDVRRKERDSLRGTIGDGKGRIVIETGSGGVRLKKS